MALQYPGALNVGSPLPANSAQHRLGMCKAIWTDFTQGICDMHPHVGVIVLYDPKREAMVLVKTSGPWQSHHYILWLGTFWHFHQPFEWLIPNPTQATDEQHGYVNFSHIVCVWVVG